jgi:hypothetical protein
MAAFRAISGIGSMANRPIPDEHLDCAGCGRSATGFTGEPVGRTAKDRFRFPVEPLVPMPVETVLPLRAPREEAAQPCHARGRVVHAVLQNWNLARWRRKPFQMRAIKTLFEKQWLELQRDLQINWCDEEATEQASALRVLEHYFTETSIKAEEKPDAVEVAAEADLSAHGLPRLIGIIDLVRSGGRIVDFKLVGKTPDGEQVMHTNEVQLPCYSVLYRDATGISEGGLELHHLVRTKTPKLVVTSPPKGKIIN